MDIGALITFPGAAAVIAFGQTHKHGLSAGPMSNVLGLLVLPAMGSMLWKMATVFSWWTIALFVAISLITGAINGQFVKKHGIYSLVAMQPFLGLVFTSCAVLCWFL